MDTLQRAKSIIIEELKKEGCRVRRILLFGSRARGDSRPDSDWDFFVITDRDVPPSQRLDVSRQIRRRFVQAGFYGDVFIRSERVAEQRRNNTGFLDYYALKEGIEI
ncbi:MAG: nucleotidyltransferase domain-containing protein [Fimbriimonadales bacterium]